MIVYYTVRPIIHLKGLTKMKALHKKRILCTALCSALLLTSLPFAEISAADSSKKSSSSESKETADLKAAIAEVKKRINIPAQLDKFSYETETRYENTFFKLCWYSEKKDEDGGSYTDCSITVEYYNGFIRHYSYYSNSTDPSYSKPHFPKLTAEKQEEYVKKHLKMLNPDLKGNIIIERATSTDSLWESEVRYDFRREESGIEFHGNSGEMTIDSNTGKLIEFNLIWWNDADCPDAAKRISEEKAAELYKSRKPLEICYSIFSDSYYDDERNRIRKDYILPVYYPAAEGENMIDAITGEYTSIYDDKKKYSYTSAYSWSGYYSDEDDIRAGEGIDSGEAIDEFTDAELAALEEENKLVSSEQALKIIKENKYIVFNKELVPSSNYISAYYDHKGNKRSLRVFDYEYTTDDPTKDSIYLTVSLDSLTGDVISFRKRYYYGDESPKKNTAPVNDDKASALAKEAAEYFIGDKASEYRELPQTESSESSEKNIEFTRYVNDIPTDFDNMKITVDSRGEVLSFQCTYHDMEFPKGKPVSEDEAYKKLFEKMKPRLYYHGFTDLQLRSHIYLTYEFESYYLINALTGERITSYGEAYYSGYESSAPKNEPKPYTDIKGHKYEKEISTLWNYDVRITDSEKLEPDKPITIEEFDKLCDKGLWYDSYFEDIYPKIYTEIKGTDGGRYEINPKMKNSLTNSELAKLYVYIYESEYYAAGGIKGIFAPPYKNVPSDDPYCGYIAIAKAKGLISGKSFSPRKTLTRGEALKILYDYICSDTFLKLYEIYKI